MEEHGAREADPGQDAPQGGNIVLRSLVKEKGAVDSEQAEEKRDKKVRKEPINQVSKKGIGGCCG